MEYYYSRSLIITITSDERHLSVLALPNRVLSLTLEDDTIETRLPNKVQSGVRRHARSLVDSGEESAGGD